MARIWMTYIELGDLLRCSPMDARDYTIEHALVLRKSPVGRHGPNSAARWLRPLSRASILRVQVGRELKWIKRSLIYRTFTKRWRNAPGRQSCVRKPAPSNQPKSPDPTCRLAGWNPDTSCSAIGFTRCRRAGLGRYGFRTDPICGRNGPPDRHGRRVQRCITARADLSRTWCAWLGGLNRVAGALSKNNRRKGDQGRRHHGDHCELMCHLTAPQYR